MIDSFIGVVVSCSTAIMRWEQKKLEGISFWSLLGGTLFMFSMNWAKSLEQAPLIQAIVSVGFSLFTLYTCHFIAGYLFILYKRHFLKVNEDAILQEVFQNIKKFDVKVLKVSDEPNGYYLASWYFEELLTKNTALVLSVVVQQKIETSLRDNLVFWNKLRQAVALGFLYNNSIPADSHLDNQPIDYFSGLRLDYKRGKTLPIFVQSEEMSIPRLGEIISEYYRHLSNQELRFLPLNTEDVNADFWKRLERIQQNYK